MSSVDGLVSGLDTTTIIKQLMTLQAAPQDRLKTSVTTSQSQVLALQTVNTAMLGLQSAAAKLTSGSAWTAAQAASTSTSVVATADSSALGGSTTFSVTRLAAAQSSVSDQTFSSLSDTTSFASPSFEIHKGTGASATTTAVNAGDGSLQGLVDGINGDATLGVRAAAVQVSSGVYRLQLTSADSGTANAFTLTGAGGDASTGLTLKPVTSAADAVLHVGDASAGFDISSPTNTVSGVMPGVTVKVTALASDVTVSTTRDTASVTGAVQSLVDAANAALGTLKNQTTQGTVNAAGTRSGAGALASDSTTRSLSQRILSMVTGGVGGKSLSSVGIASTRDGALTFDADKFRKAFADNPAATQALFSNAIPAKVATATTPAVDAVAGTGLADAMAKFAGATGGTSGTLSLAIAGRTSTIKDLSDRIADWDVRLADQKASLTKQYASLETALGKLKNQSTWLAGQLNALSGSSSS